MNIVAKVVYIPKRVSIYKITKKCNQDIQWVSCIGQLIMSTADIVGEATITCSVSY